MYCAQTSIVGFFVYRIIVVTFVVYKYFNSSVYLMKFTHIKINYLNSSASHNYIIKRYLEVYMAYM